MDLSFFSRYWQSLVQPRHATAVVAKDNQPESEHKDTQDIASTDEHRVKRSKHKLSRATDKEHDRWACPFLSLPPEMRNMIYRYALVEGDIFMDPTMTQPAVLQLNRQIRSEAKQIYYQENNFYWALWANNAEKYIAWCTTSKQRRNAKCKWKLRGPRNWANLLKWLEAFYNGECRAPSYCNEQMGRTKTGKTAATARLLLLTKKMKLDQKLEWKDVRGNLELVHESFCVLDRKWMWEKDAV